VLQRTSLQHEWVRTARKKARKSLRTIDDLKPALNGQADSPKSLGRVRFSLESNSSQEFQKADPPSMHSRAATPPKLSRKPAFGILKKSPIPASLCH